VLPQWVNWKYEYRKGKWTKPLYQPNDGYAEDEYAESDNPDTWGTFDAAIAAYLRGSFDGIGFVVTGEDDFAGVDLDHCRDPETETIQPWAMQIVETLNSYTEISPSGTGVRIFLYAKLPPKDRKIGNFECYESGRYLTITGTHLPGTPMTIEHRQKQMEEVHAEVFAERNKPRPNGKINIPSMLPNLDDQELLDKAFNARNGEAVWRLYYGDINKYGSHSEADLALCSHLAFYTGPDYQKLDRLFRASDLCRPKWDDRRGDSTYGQMTVDRALGGRTEFYHTGGPNSDGSGLNSLNSHLPAQPKWPDALAPEAFYGLAGDIVRAIAPHTEPDPAALLVNLLVAFGNAAGSAPHAIAEADQHGTNLFATLVGTSSKGRKGSSWGHIRELFRRADPEWTDNRIMGGLSSGEGLLWAVRDPIEKTEAVRDKGKPTGETATYQVDPGVEDKRLLVVEPEFASVLQVMWREKNTLSAIIRQAWDSTGVLRTMTKNSPAKATGAHVSIIGHITRDELLRHLTETEAANGFGNRFLWICTKRAQFLPEGGGQPNYNSLVEYLHNALDLAKKMGTLHRDDESRAVWAELYPELSSDRMGLFGNITNRAEAQVLRLSVLYAALDGAQWVRLPHLEAALAVWQYAEASAKWIFGDRTGDEVADRILDALGHGEMDRTAMYYLFGKHVKAERLSAALTMLHSLGRIKKEVRESDGGRPREAWMRA
jgi:hypothetical protein